MNVQDKVSNIAGVSSANAPVTVEVTFKEGGYWWKLILPGPITTKIILNSGKIDGVQICALRLKLDSGSEITYDFILRGWR